MNIVKNIADGGNVMMTDSNLHAKGTDRVTFGLGARGDECSLSARALCKGTVRQSDNVCQLIHKYGAESVLQSGKEAEKK